MSAPGPPGGGDAPLRSTGRSLFLALFGLYLLTASFRIDTPDTRVRLQVARHLAHDGTPAIEPVQLPTEFGVVGAFPGRDGRAYSVYGLGQPALMVPLVLLAGDRDAEAVTYDGWHGYWRLARERHVPAFPFGFGLSYTSWELGPTTLDEEGDDASR